MQPCANKGDRLTNFCYMALLSSLSKAFLTYKHVSVLAPTLFLLSTTGIISVAECPTHSYANDYSISLVLEAARRRLHCITHR